MGQRHYYTPPIEAQPYGHIPLKQFLSNYFSFIWINEHIEFNLNTNKIPVNYAIFKWMFAILFINHWCWHEFLEKMDLIVILRNQKEEKRNTVFKHFKLYWHFTIWTMHIVKQGRDGSSGDEKKTFETPFP